MTPERSGRKTRAPDGLTDDDRQVWELVTGRVDPLVKRKRRVIAADSETDGRTAPAPPARVGVRVEREPEPKMPRETAAPVRARPAAPPKQAAPPAPVAIERRKTRKLASGRRAIEAVLDLHGMRQTQAHASLGQFLRASHASGYKFVKVITGKGAPAGDDDVDSFGIERGVLKRMVPLWLREPGLSTLVVGTASAGRSHGGDGALYVELRKRAKTG